MRVAGFGKFGRILVVPALAFPAHALAQDAAADGAAPIIVAANRAPLPADQVGGWVTVVESAVLDRASGTGLAEVLARTPGVQFARNGGPGAVTSLFIRGADSGQSVVLVDGVRLHDPSTTDGGASLADMLAGDVARVELLRGTQSTLYGSQAIGGVIAVQTQAPVNPLQGTVQLEGGTLDSLLARASIGGIGGPLAWRLGASWSATDGVSAYSPGVERDGYRNLTLNGSLAYTVTQDVALDLRALFTSGSADFDGYNVDSAERAENDSLLTYAGITFPLFGRLANRIGWARTEIDRDFFDDAPGASPARTFLARGTSDRLEYQGTLDIAPGYFAVVGVEHAENRMVTAAPNAFDPAPVPLRAQDRTTGLYTQVTGKIAHGLTLAGGLRGEDHSTFGGHSVGSLSAAWSVNGGGTVLRASWAEGFKAPGLYQLYSEYGNVALIPETSAGWDAGVEQRLPGGITLAATWFNRRTRNLIGYTGCFDASVQPLCADGRYGYYENTGRARARGLELAAAIAAGRFSASANYTWLDARNTTPGDASNGNRLARRPRDTFNGAASYVWAGGITASASIRVAGRSFNDAWNSTIIDGHTLVGAALSWPVMTGLELYARADNLLDERYELASDYGTLPRTVTGGARYRF